MIETIFSGIGLGIALSFLTGPAFFALLKTSLEKGFYAGAAFATGILLSDLIYVSIALFGSSYIALEQKYLVPIGIAGSLILLGIGLYYLVMKIKINRKKEDDCFKPHHQSGYMFKAFFMCIFNPALLIYWISVTGGILSLTGGEVKIGKIIPFFACILGTQFCIDCLKAYYANKLSHRIEEKNIARFTKLAGVLIIIFALRLMYDTVTHHH
ncbi:Threonine/homoserine/homoserine lactone efflux protein [bacterium A37T11]|nr:Threonine/homoserine/homoserine lactone efflux protein [bacterium A37T11]